MLSDKTADRSDIPIPKWRQRVHEVIFEADTPAGKLFDILLLAAILLSVLAVMLESVKEIDRDYGHILEIVEWVFTAMFTVEYIARIISVGKPFRYIFSFYGLIDLISIVPTYLGLFISNAQVLTVVRAIRLLRVFRIFKFARYLREADRLMDALRASKARITVFFGAVFMICIIMGTLMYLIEGEHPHKPGEGFTSIPRSIYWAIVTLTTVGYGDISPETPLGQAVSSFIMILGYAIIAVPTGIVTAELVSNKDEIEEVSTQACQECSREGHDPDADYCKFCGAKL